MQIDSHSKLVGRRFAFGMRMLLRILVNRGSGVTLIHGDGHNILLRGTRDKAYDPPRSRVNFQFVFLFHRLWALGYVRYFYLYCQSICGKGGCGLCGEALLIGEVHRCVGPGPPWC